MLDQTLRWIEAAAEIAVFAVVAGLLLRAALRHKNDPPLKPAAAPKPRHESTEEDPGGD